MIILPVESIDLEDFRSAYASGSMRRIFSMSRFEHIEALKDKIIQSRLENWILESQAKRSKEAILSLADKVQTMFKTPVPKYVKSEIAMGVPLLAISYIYVDVPLIFSINCKLFSFINRARY